VLLEIAEMQINIQARARGGRTRFLRELEVHVPRVNDTTASVAVLEGL
jgi:hypothetical protein